MRPYIRFPGGRFQTAGHSGHVPVCLLVVGQGPDSPIGRHFHHFRHVRLKFRGMLALVSGGVYELCLCKWYRLIKGE